MRRGGGGGGGGGRGRGRGEGGSQLAGGLLRGTRGEAVMFPERERKRGRDLETRSKSEMRLIHPLIQSFIHPFHPIKPIP